MSTQHITSRQNQRVKDAAKLRDRRARERQGRFVIDGAREIARAVAAGVEILEAYQCEPLAHGDEAAATASELRRAAAAFAIVTDEVFEKLCFGDGRDGLVAVARTPRRGLADIALPPAPLVAVLEGVEKPGNVGAVLRSADGAGIDAVILADPRTDLFNPNTIRASLFKPNVCVATAAEAIAWLRAAGVPMFAAKPPATAGPGQAAVNYAGSDYRGGAAFVLGSEAAGLTSTWDDAAVTAIALPMHGMADSLNVSTTAAVLFYEARRQRTL
jgi:TrmH family RNA methyltransferase